MHLQQEEEEMKKMSSCDWRLVWNALHHPEHLTHRICKSNEAVADLQMVMSWCPRRHHPPCSSLLLMLEPPLLLFSLSLSLFLFLPLQFSFLFLSPFSLSLSLLLSYAASQPGRVTELTSQSTASENQSLAWHDMLQTVWGAVGTHTLDSRRQASSATLMRLLTAVSNTLYVHLCVWVRGGCAQQREK